MVRRPTATKPPPLPPPADPPPVPSPAATSTFKASPPQH
eukprot:gene48495-8050_t